MLFAVVLEFRLRTRRPGVRISQGAPLFPNKYERVFVGHAKECFRETAPCYRRATSSLDPAIASKSCHELQSGSHLCRETGMEIAIQSSDELEQLRNRLRKMSDAQLVRFGKAASNLCRDPRCPRGVQAATRGSQNRVAAQASESAVKT